MWVLWVLQMIAFCVIYIADSIPTFLELGFLFLLMHLKTKFQNGTWQLTWKYMGGADTWSMWFQPSMFHKTEQQSTLTIFNFAVRSFLIWFQKRVLHLFFFFCKNTFLWLTPAHCRYKLNIWFSHICQIW